MSSNLSTLNEAGKLDDVGIHDFESVGSILRRMLDPKIGAAFDPVPSLALDRVIQKAEDAA